MKICFYSLNAYPLLSGTNLGYIGGAELQQSLIGKELSRKGFNVSFIVFDHGQKDNEVIENIKIFKTVPKGYSLSNLFSLFKAVHSAWKALSKADADIYFQQCASRDTGFVALFCFLKRKKFIFLLASDMDVDGTFLKNAKRYEKILYRFGLGRADKIIAQSHFQQNLLKNKYNYDSVVIKNPYPVKNDKQLKDEPPIILWVGTIRPQWKRPELFLKLAKEIPEARFQMIGGPSEDIKFYNTIKNDAKKIQNLEFLGFVNYNEIEEYFQRASILVSTSDHEGFPNVFLQAWAAGMPVVSLEIDPDEIICDKQLGAHSKTFNNLVFDLKKMLENKSLRKQVGSNGRKYVEQEHDNNMILKKFVSLLKNEL